MGLPSGDGAFSQPHTRAHPDAHLEEPSSNAAQHVPVSCIKGSSLRQGKQQQPVQRDTSRHLEAVAGGSGGGSSRQRRAAANGQDSRHYDECDEDDEEQLYDQHGPEELAGQVAVAAPSIRDKQHTRGAAAAAAAAVAGSRHPARNVTRGDSGVGVASTTDDEEADSDEDGSSGSSEDDEGDDGRAPKQQEEGDGAVGRSARAGRALRDSVRKPQLLQLAEAPRQRQHSSKRQQRQQQRKLEELARRQQHERQLELQRKQQHEAEVQAALRAAASGRLTRHTVKVIEEIDGIDQPVDAFDASPAAAAAGAEDGTAVADHAAGAALQQEPGAVGVGKAARGLRGEALRLQQQLQQLKAHDERAARAGSGRDRRDRAAAAAAGRQQQRQHGSCYRDSLDDDVGGLLSDEEEGEEAGAADEGTGRQGGRQLRQRATRQRQRQQEQQQEQEEGSDEEDEEEDGDGDGDDDEDEEDEGTVRKRYQLRSRERQGIDRFSPRHGTSTGVKRTSGAGGRGSGERRRDRAGGRRGGARRRGGFAEGDSSSDGDDLLGRLRGDGHWNSFLAACGQGPYLTPGGLHNTLNTPAAAIAAAAAAAATGLLSPGRGLDRRGSFLLGGEAAADAAAAAGGGGGAGAGSGSGWGHWGGSGAADGGLGAWGKDAAATAGGREGRGGLGQELITPLQVDASIGFDQVGGLDQYLAALKEMIFLPLLYPELFEKFGVNPPRGVLFHGPPGTGKTLVARALAAQASRAAGQKVSFYMRKGADLLSKWVGEAEKQLRLLFEEAARNQPAIIFFDEIDGLAPVRTSKQDQVHNSIVSTLLALMDGLESRGRVVLIGATNRPDALDPALRRPGRFDRELLFPLPDLTARRSILGIHSRAWRPQPDPVLLDELAVMTGGYCGADIKALCAEASLAALRRVYPQVYDSDTKLLINPDAVVVIRQDFMTAMQGLTPAAHRATASQARPLNPVIAPCLTKPLQAALAQLKHLFPPAAACLAAAADAAAGKGSSSSAASAPQQRLSSAIIASKSGNRLASSSGFGSGFGGSSSSKLFCMSRPRLLLAGPAGSGQQQLGAAVLAALEGLPVHAIGLPSLLATSGSRCVEETLVSAFTEARRAAPAILYWPQAHLWWAAAGSGLRCALTALLDDLPPDLPLLLLATVDLAEEPSGMAEEYEAANAAGRSKTEQLWQLQQARLATAGASSSQVFVHGQQQQQQSIELLGLDASLAELFPAVGSLAELVQGPAQQQQQRQQDVSLQQHQQQQQLATVAGCDVLGRVVLGYPGAAERQEMFKVVLDAAAAPPVPEAAPSQQPPPEALPQAPAAAAAAEAAKAAAEAAAARQAYEQDQAVLRSLRIVLRTIVTRAISQKRYRLFAEPPLPDEDGGFEALQALSCPMDLLTMLYKIDHQQYLTPAAFLADAHLIVRCAEELYGEPEVAAAALVQQAAAAPAAGNTAAAAGATEGGGAANPAAGQAAAADDKAAAGAAAGSLPVLTRSLPAVRVAVCKEISRAMELKDELETQVYQLLSPELVRCCEAIAAKGGPAPPPPGMTLPRHLLPPPYSRAADGAAGRLGAQAGAAADGSTKATRSTSRLIGKPLDKRLMHADPEALMRALKQKPPRAAAAAQPAAAAAAADPGNKLQQQEPEQAAAADAEMVDAADTPAADQQQQQETAANDAHAIAAPADSVQLASIPTAATSAAAAAHGSMQGSPLALKPMTNGQSRKRPAAGAAERERAAKVVANEQQQQRQPEQLQQQPAAASSDAAGAAVAGAAVEGGAAGHQQQQQLLLGSQVPQGATAAAAAGGANVVVAQAHDHTAADAAVSPALPAALAAPPKATDVAAAEVLLQRLVAATAGMQLAGLELLHARLSRVVAAQAQQQDRQLVLQQVAGVVAAVEQDAAGGVRSLAG